MLSKPYRTPKNTYLRVRQPLVVPEQEAQRLLLTRNARVPELGHVTRLDHVIGHVVQSARVLAALGCVDVDSLAF